MAWPSSSARTKTWGTEILTAGDLDGQFDILHTYNNDQLNGTTGHKHSGGTNDGPLLPLTTAISGVLPVANGGTNVASYGVGDILYASASTTLSKLSPSSAGQALSSAGATTAPAFAGMTTQGDVEYHNGTQRTALAAGTAGQVLKTLGAGANPAWVNALASVSDYGSSQSTSTARQATAIKIAYGYISSIGSGSNVGLSNLPFTSSSSFVVICSCGTPPTLADEATGLIAGHGTSGSTATIYNTDNAAKDAFWFAIGV